MKETQTNTTFTFTPISAIYAEKTLREIRIHKETTDQTTSQATAEMPTPILFYTPNRIPDELMPNQSEAKPEYFRTPKNDFFRRSLALAAPNCLKMSTSMADLLPSRFPTDEEDESLEMAVNSETTMIGSSLFTSSVIEESGNDEQFPDESQTIGIQQGRRFSRHKNLSKIIKNFRHGIERTKSAFRASLNEDLKMKIPSSRSFPLASSTSTISLENYWRKHILHRDIHASKVNYKIKNFVFCINLHLLKALNFHFTFVWSFLPFPVIFCFKCQSYTFIRIIMHERTWPLATRECLLAVWTENAAWNSFEPLVCSARENKFLFGTVGG